MSDEATKTGYFRPDLHSYFALLQNSPHAGMSLSAPARNSSITLMTSVLALGEHAVFWCVNFFVEGLDPNINSPKFFCAGWEPVCS